MREYGVKVCSEECAVTAVETLGVTGDRIWTARQPEVDEEFSDVAYCPACGTKLGIDERGPWRERMVPRAALEEANAKLPKSGF
jgi:hypothetical protein